MTFYWRVALLNALVFTVGAILLVITPATVSAPVVLSEVLILVAGIGGLLLLNMLIIRWAFGPLERLMELMRRTDLTRPGERLEAGGPPEVGTVVDTFNAMLERLEGERRATARRALEAQEAERKRVAQELHDEIGQSLTAVLISLSRAADRAGPDAAPELAQATEAARGSLEEVRRVAQRLRPETLADLGLPSAVITLCRRFAEQSGAHVDRHIDLALPRLEPEQELVVYRVAQESLTNIARHAEASRVGVRLERNGRGLALTVRDDGRGMRGEPGGGISGMRERALLIGAELTVGDRSEGGVEVRLVVPDAVAAP